VAVYFFDSSALVKRYAQETGSEWVIATTEPQAGHTLYIARITAVEVVSAITRRRRSGALSETDAATASFDFRYDLSHQYRAVEVTATVIAQAMELVVKQALRGYDAVQLGAALVVHNLRVTLGLPAFVLVSADRELNAAATADGLTVDDPNDH